MRERRRKRPLSPKEIAAIREEKEAAKEISPQEKRRQAVINMGVGILLLAFITTSGITCVNMGSYSKSARQAEQQGNKKTDQLTYEMERWQKEVEARPNDPSALANLAYYQIEHGDRNIGKKEEANKDYEAATQKLEAALKIDPENAFALRTMARVKVRQDKYDEAKAQLEAALKAAQKPVDPKDPEKEAKENASKDAQVQARFGLADLAMRKKDHKTALEQLEEIIKVDPGSLEAYYGRAEIYAEQKQPELARKDIDTVMKIVQAMPPSAASMQAGQRAQILLYELDQASAPTPSGTPRGTATPAPASGTPAPAASPTASAATPSPTPPATATPTPAASGTP